MQVEIVGEFSNLFGVAARSLLRQNLVRIFTQNLDAGSHQAKENDWRRIVVAQATHGEARLLVKLGFVNFERSPQVVDQPVRKFDRIQPVVTRLEQGQVG